MYKKLTIAHLYPNEMNIYGDMGNIITIQNRCKWRHIGTEIVNVNIGDKSIPDADIIFMGGGQDNDMLNVYKDLLKKRTDLQKLISQNKLFLLICGGLQLFGDYFISGSGEEIKGLGILSLITKAPGNSLQDRCLGNIVTLLEQGTLDLAKSIYPNLPSKYIVGFENHSGQTFFTNKDVLPLAKVIHGKGNNSREKVEGVRKDNIFASYCHGSLLPKNPHLADILISLAMKNKYNIDQLSPLDDTVEWQAHFSMLRKLGIN